MVLLWALRLGKTCFYLYISSPCLFDPLSPIQNPWWGSGYVFTRSFPTSNPVAQVPPYNPKKPSYLTNPQPGTQPTSSAFAPSPLPLPRATPRSSNPPNSPPAAPGPSPTASARAASPPASSTRSRTRRPRRPP